MKLNRSKRQEAFERDLRLFLQKSPKYLQRWVGSSHNSFRPMSDGEEDRFTYLFMSLLAQRSTSIPKCPSLETSMTMDLRRITPQNLRSLNHSSRCERTTSETKMMISICFLYLKQEEDVFLTSEVLDSTHLTETSNMFPPHMQQWHFVSHERLR